MRSVGQNLHLPFTTNSDDLSPASCLKLVGCLSPAGGLFVFKEDRCTNPMTSVARGILAIVVHGLHEVVFMDDRLMLRISMDEIINVRLLFQMLHSFSDTRCVAEMS